MKDMKKNILLGITSSIAAYKVYELIRLYKKNNYNIKVILSENALNFVSPLVLETLCENEIYYKQFAPRTNVEHIGLVDWADIFIIAPISANTISKCANGIADNLLCSVFCAFVSTKKPVLFAPAMNTNMWNNPFIKENVEKLKKQNINFIDPQEGFLACGTNGCGRLADINIIYETTLKYLFQNKKNNNKKIIITMGGTKEAIDNVRCITNFSSGKMGRALCKWAYRLGYEVCCISTLPLENETYKTINVSTAQEMLKAVQENDFDYLIMAAAVCDFKVENKSEHKILKENIKNDFELKLTFNPDVIKTIAENKKENQKITGFCLADDDPVNCAKKKLQNKNLDFIVANEIKTALNTDKNKVTIIEKSGKIINIDLDTKDNIAKKILEVVCD